MGRVSWVHNVVCYLNDSSQSDYFRCLTCSSRNATIIAIFLNQSYHNRGRTSERIQLLWIQLAIWAWKLVASSCFLGTKTEVYDHTASFVSVSSRMKRQSLLMIRNSRYHEIIRKFYLVRSGAGGIDDRTGCTDHFAYQCTDHLKQYRQVAAAEESYISKFEQDGLFYREKCTT